MTLTQPEATPSSESLSPEKEIARGVVSIYKEYLGRGPEHARTTITDSEALTVLGGSLTKAERTLIDGGDSEAVRQLRRRFQDAMRKDITALVGRITGREAASFMSDHDVLTDTAVEMVVFKPLDPA